jgi:endonuclease-3
VNARNKAKKIDRILEELFPNPPVPLDHRDPYTLLVAVLLSAQCTDARVNQVTPALFTRAASPEEMAQLEVEEIRELIKPCGLSPTKAKNIHALSQILRDQYGGSVPTELEALEALPGVGHKTASVVVAQAFGQPAFPVDTHIHRLAWRWGLSDGSSVERTEVDLEALFPKERWRDVHLQIIYFGRKYCPARGHRPDACPICSWAGVRERLVAEEKTKAVGEAQKAVRAKKKAAGSGRRSPPRATPTASGGA